MTIVLFLDADWQPLRIEPWTRAITDLFLGKVEVIEYSRDRTIKGVAREVPMPAVVRVLRRFRRDRQGIRFSRVNIYTRDGFACQYCGERLDTEDLTFDHVVPRSRGGHASWTNIVTACMACNVAKGNRTLAECGMRPLAMPAVPTARQLYENGRAFPRRAPHASWRDYLYWNVELDPD
jgi:5-methylcytosine-specific restriction endonuclease McrA